MHTANFRLKTNKIQVCSHWEGGISCNFQYKSYTNWEQSLTAWGEQNFLMISYEVCWHSPDTLRDQWSSQNSSSFLIKAALKAVLATNTSLSCQVLLTPFHIHDGQMTFLSFLEYTGWEEMLKRQSVEYKLNKLYQHEEIIWFMSLIFVFWKQYHSKVLFHVIKICIYLQEISTTCAMKTVFKHRTDHPSFLKCFEQFLGHSWVISFIYAWNNNDFDHN